MMGCWIGGFLILFQEGVLPKSLSVLVTGPDINSLCISIQVRVTGLSYRRKMCFYVLLFSLLFDAR